MTPEEAYEHNHGEWVIGARGRDGKERFALFSFEGTIVQAVEITGMRKTRPFPDDPKRDDKYTIDGTILEKGHPIFDKYVGEAQPVARAGTRSATTRIRNSTWPAENYAGADAVQLP